MLSIGEFAKAAKLSTRAVRFYESIGLLKSSLRGENNYRYFDPSQLEQLEKIQNLKDLGFSLNEVKEVLALGTASIRERLEQKLFAVEREVEALKDRKDRLQILLSISHRVETSQAVGLQERRMYMDVVTSEVISGVRERQGDFSEEHQSFLDREKCLYDSDEKRAFIEGVKKCVAFAKKNSLTLGPGRGSCPSSLVLYGLGFSGIDPTGYDLLPERLSTTPPDIHIDVEFDRGQPFVDYCRMVSQQLPWGQITAFKMPLPDIIQRVHQRIGEVIDYTKIADDDPVVLQNIQRGDIEKIFAEFKIVAPSEVYELLLEESLWSFCKAHAMAFAQFTKQTAVLKTLHKKVYFEEIDKWQSEHEFV